MVNNPREFNIQRKVESKPKEINVPCLTNSKPEIAGAGSLNIRACKNYRELVTTNLELKVFINFLDILKKIEKKKQVIWIRGKIIKIIQVGEKNQCPGKIKKRKGKCACCFGYRNRIFLHFL